MAQHRSQASDPRWGRTCIEAQLLETFWSGKLNRREFLRHGAAIGLSLPILGAVAGGLGLVASPRRLSAAQPGGLIRVGQSLPATAIEPVRATDLAGIAQLSAVGEYLCFNGADFMLRPMLAESWSPNGDGSIWMFKLRKGVRFHDGRTMSADDVVATFERLTDPDSGSDALPLLLGYLSKGGTKRVDDTTVEFHLDAAHGNFPYLVSSDNYNSIIVPAGYRDDFESDFVATGPFKLEKYTERIGSSFVRNEDYWGPRALPDRVEYSFWQDVPAQIEALKAGRIDIIQQVPLQLGAELSGEPGIEVLALPSGSHHQVHMRTDMAPFTDSRVRRAVALCLDRPALMRDLVGGHARLGNDGPFALAYPFTDGAVAQRGRNIPEARQLLEAAGLKDGFKTTLLAENYLEVPRFAAALVRAAAEIGGHIELDVREQAAYYGEGVFGKSPWLDSAMGITDFSHRGLPNVCLMASLGSEGGWNAARFRDPAYDRLVTTFIAALDIDAQRRAAGEIERLLLDQTPIIFAYFHDILIPMKKGVTGLEATAMGHLRLGQATLAP